MATSLKHHLLTGAIAGFVSTVPQTIAMLIARQVLPLKHPGRFPPRQVTEGVFAKVHGSKPSLKEPTWWAATTASHFGYGSSMGTLYSALPAKPASAVTRGALFGLLVWVGSYFGLLPAMGIHSPHGDQPVRKNFQLIVAHLAYGISNAIVFEWLNGRGGKKR